MNDNSRVPEQNTCNHYFVFKQFTDEEHMYSRFQCNKCLTVSVPTHKRMPNPFTTTEEQLEQLRPERVFGPKYHTK